MVDDESQVTAASGVPGSASAPSPAPAAPPVQTLPPRRSTAMWTICVALVLVLVVTVLEGARLGGLGLAGVLLGAGVARLIVPGPGPVGIVIRSRGIDAAMFIGLAAVIAFLAQTAPDI